MLGGFVMLTILGLVEVNNKLFTAIVTNDHELDSFDENNAIIKNEILLLISIYEKFQSVEWKESFRCLNLNKKIMTFSDVINKKEEMNHFFSEFIKNEWFMSSLINGSSKDKEYNDKYQLFINGISEYLCFIYSINILYLNEIIDNRNEDRYERHNYWVNYLDMFVFKDNISTTFLPNNDNNNENNDNNNNENNDNNNNENNDNNDENNDNDIDDYINDNINSETDNSETYNGDIDNNIDKYINKILENDVKPHLTKISTNIDNFIEDFIGNKSQSKQIEQLNEENTNLRNELEKVKNELDRYKKIENA